MDLYSIVIRQKMYVNTACRTKRRGVSGAPGTTPRKREHPGTSHPNFAVWYMNLLPLKWRVFLAEAGMALTPPMLAP